MNFVSMSARKTTQHHFKRKGLGWRGFLGSYYRLEGFEAIRHTIFCDEIVDETNLQDNVAVLSMIDVFILQLGHEIPCIRAEMLQSDNTGCYQSNELLLMLSLIVSTSPATIRRFIHTKNPDEKSRIDARFA